MGTADGLTLKKVEGGDKPRTMGSLQKLEGMWSIVFL